MTEPITIETYCQVCSHPLGPDDDPRGFHRGPCPRPYAAAPDPAIWDYTRVEPPVARETNGEPVTKGAAAVTNSTSVTSPNGSVTATCRVCHVALPQVGKGRPRAFCSDACRQTAHRRES